MRRFTGNSQRALGLVCAAQFVAVLDVTIVATALPAIGRTFTAGGGTLQWVVTAYAVCFGAALLTGGRLTDQFGPRRMFVLGLAVFTVAGLGCALAWNLPGLVAFRALQGLGSAALVPAALAELHLVGGAGATARRAVAWWTASAAVGGASGWLLGGVLTEYLGWRAVFWVNLPVGTAVVLAAAVVLPVGARRADVRVDLPGAIGSTASLALVIAAVTGFGEHGGTDPGAWIFLALATVLGAAVAGYERRLAVPLVPARVIADRAAAGADVTALLLTATTTPAMLLSVLYVQQLLGWSPARASLLFPVFNIAVVAGSLLGPRLLQRTPARAVLAAGFVAVALGTAVLATLQRSLVPVGFALLGAGLGAASVASTHVGTQRAPESDRGVAGGLLTASAQLGTGLGLAVATPLATDSDGFRTGYLVVVGIALAGVVASRLVPAVVTAAAGDQCKVAART